MWVRQRALALTWGKKSYTTRTQLNSARYFTLRLQKTLSIFPITMELADDRSRVFDSYPDGGFRAYSIVFGAWLALLPASGLLNSTGIFQAWLLKHELRSYTEAQIAWIFSFFAFLFFFGGCQAGLKTEVLQHKMPN
jgi:hypothetical protein